MSIAGHLSRKKREYYSQIRMAEKRAALDAIEAVSRGTERNGLSTFSCRLCATPMARIGQATYHEEIDSTVCEFTS